MITSSIETITPKMAEKMLSGHRNYRTKNQMRVDSYADTMRDGLWLISTIIVSDTGELMDGQHRLHAVIKHGRPVDFLVVRGMPIENISAIDNGMARTAGQVMTAELGAKNANKVSALLRFVIPSEVSHSMMRCGANTAKIIDAYKRFPWIQELCDNTTQGFLSQTVLSAPFARMIAKDISKKDEVINLLYRANAGDWGEDRMSGIRIAVANYNANKRQDRINIYMRMARALVAYMQGETLAKLYACTEDPFSRTKV